MNEAFELSGPGSFLTCTFHVLFPAGVENLRCPGPGPTVEPGCGSRLPVLNEQWQPGTSCRELNSVAAAMEVRWEGKGAGAFTQCGQGEQQKECQGEISAVSGHGAGEERGCL